MNQIPLIQVRVLYFDGTPAPNAHFGFRSAEGAEYRALYGRYDTVSGVYTFVLENFRTGPHLMRVETPGYGVIEKNVEFGDAGYSGEIFLVEDDTECVKMGGRRVYFRRRPDLAGVYLPEGDEREASAREMLVRSAERSPAGRPEGEYLLKSGHIRVFSNNAADARRGTGKESLRSTIGPEDSGAPVLDQPIETTGGYIEFLSRRIGVELVEGAVWEDVEKDLDLRDVRVLYRDINVPRFYLIEVLSPVPYRVLDVSEQLLASPLVKRSEPEMENPADLAAPIFPADLLRPWQWHHNVLRTPQAWGEADAVNNAIRFGSADVVIAVHDDGIEVTAAGVVLHPDLQGVVTGGSVTGYLGGNNAKVYYQYDFSAAPAAVMLPHNANAPTNHGMSTSSVATAQSDGATGVVGTAPNARLASYLWSKTDINTRWAHSFQFMSGLNPGWTPGGLYHANEPFPTDFGIGGNAGPGASIINCSHTKPAASNLALQGALNRITMIGRNRRGVVGLVAACNTDRPTRAASEWGNDVNLIKVGASSLDHRGYEILAVYSAYSTVIDPGIDVSAPSSNIVWLPIRHNPPRQYGVIADNWVNGSVSNNVPGTNVVQAIIQNDPPPNANFLTLLPVDLPNFPIGTEVLIRDPGNPERIEHNTITAPPGGSPPNSVGLATPLDLDFPPNSFLITGALDYTDAFGGTSAATPMVSGVVALLLSVNPKLTWAEVRQILRDTSVPIAIRFLGPLRSKRWVDATNTDVIDADGVMDIPAGAPAATITSALNKGDTQINLATPIAFQPRQAITIGAESKLSVVTDPTGAVTPANRLTVVRGTDFERGDTIHIGKLSETVLESPVAAVAIPGTGVQIPVINPDGFVVGDIIEIRTVPPQQLTITALNFSQPMASSNNGRNLIVADTVGGVAFAAAAIGDIVRIAPAQREGPFTITAKAGNQLTLSANVTQVHPANRIVQKEDTEVAVVKRMATPTQVEVYPLINSHPVNNIPANLHITGGRIAFYSHGFGYGRVDAYEAVRAAINYTHDDRDLMIRNFIGDDGVTNRSTQPVASPDLWITNDVPTPAGMAYGTDGPHQHPRTDISAPVFIGSGLNDLSVSGAFTDAAVTTYVIEISATGAADSFTWRVEGGVPSAPTAMTGALQAVDTKGLSVRFNAVTGHTVGDTWRIRCEKVANRHIHLRIRNRGLLPTFAASGAGGITTPAYQYRVFLCLSDGSPVVQHYPVPGTVGQNDLRAVSDYTGAAKDIITIRIKTTGAPDTFEWAKGSAVLAGNVPITGAAQLIVDGVSIQFGATTGHSVGETWVLKCYPAAQKFMNIDHYIEKNPAAGAFNLSVNRPGTWMLTDPDPSVPASILPVFAAGESRYYSIPWPETNRPPRNGAGVAAPARPLRMFIMGEVTPHDGRLMGDIAEQDNNFSYREIIFARFGFKQGNLVEELANYIEVDSFGTVTHDDFNVQVISDVSTFRTESVKLEFVLTNIDGSTVTKVFEHNGGGWSFTGGAPVWADMDLQPVKASGAAAAGEQYHIMFVGRVHLSRDHKSLKITPKIHSAINPGVVLAEESRTVAVYEQAKLASSRYTGVSAADLVPQSHFFTDHAAVAVQADTMAYGPVISGIASDKQNKYRVTGLFKAAADVNAYAVVDGLFMIQRVADPGSPGSYLPNVINLILKPYRQAMLGFTPVKYFVYRNLRLDNFLKGTSSADEKLVRPNAGANAFIQSLWTTHTNQNGAVPFESSALGYDPATQTGAGKIDKLFNRQDANRQLPFVGRGTNIGKFYTNGGADPFGIEVILEEGDFQPDFNYARRYKETIIDVSGLPSGTPQEKFTIRLKREEILNYIDPAAFFGMHMSKDGWLQVDDGAGNKTKLAGTDIYDTVIAKFHTRNTLYLDIRNENGLSLNFYGKYDDASAAHNALEVGTTAGSLAAQPYASEQWPIIIRPSASAPVSGDRNRVFIRLRRDYNHKPILYIEHGEGETITRGRFIAGTDLIAPLAPTTNPLGFRFPNKDLGSGNRIGVAWMLKMHYAMRQDAANSPFPAEVVPTATYLDNIFGPVDMEPFWSVSSPVIAWSALQDRKYVDGEGIENLGFEHVANRGMAFSQWTPGGGTTGTVLFYAAAKDSFLNEGKKFVPHNALASGTSKRKSFFDEPMLFDGYTVGYDVFTDGSTEVLSMQLQEVPPDPRPAEAMMLLGLTRSQLETTLKPLAGFDLRYPRTVLLQEVAGSPFTDASGAQYRKYKAGLRGMNSSGTAHQAFPSTDLFVYTVDRKFFFSHAFTQAQTLPTTYRRNYEEAFGARTRYGATYPISAASGMTVTVAGQNLLHEIVPGDKVNIKGTDRLVASVSFTGSNTVITLTTSPGVLAPGTDTVRGPNKSYEDYFIAKDQLGFLSGIERIVVPVSTFISLVNGVANTSAAPAALESIINNHAPDVLKRARLFSSNAGFSYADDRTLYWARIKMAVALKSHPYLLKVLKQRNRLVKLLETKTRGYDSVSFASAGGRKKVLLTGYDPFKLGANIRQSNPSGATVLALHGGNFTDGTNNIHIQTAIFPVRYADFDQNPPPNAGTGVVESFIERFINPAHPGYNAADVPDIIVTLSQGVLFTFWLERFAGRTRGGGTDNLNEGNIPFPATVPGDEFYQTTLPHAKIVPAAQTAGVFKSIYHETYSYFRKSGGGWVLETQATGPDPSTLTESTTPKKSEIISVEGSGSNYLSNEIFYRVSRLRQLHNPAMKTGHYHIPAIQHGPGVVAYASPVNAGVKTTEDFNGDLTRQIIEEIRNALLRAFS